MVGVSEVTWVRVVVEVKVVRVVFVGVPVVLSRPVARCVWVVHQVPAAVKEEPRPTEMGSEAEGAIEPLHQHPLCVREALVVKRAVFLSLYQCENIFCVGQLQICIFCFYLG